MLADLEIQEKILWEAHQSVYTIHPGSTKVYKNLKYIFPGSNEERFWTIHGPLSCIPPSESGTCTNSQWANSIVYLSLCGNRRISQWILQSGYHDHKRGETVWVVVDQLTKSSHFLPIHITWTVGKLAQCLYQ